MKTLPSVSFHHAARPSAPSSLHQRHSLARTCATVALAAAGALGLSDCASQPTSVATTIQVPSLRAHDQEEITRDGITITVRPITVDNYRRFPQAHRRVNWTRVVSSQGRAVSVPGGSDANLVPLPAFQVRVANHTGHVVRFTQSLFRLQDNLGQSYPLFAGMPELVAWNEGLWGTLAANAPELLPQILPQVRAGAGQIQMLNRSTELLNGDEWSGYLVFNVNVSTINDYYTLMNSVNRFTLRLAEIPVEVNEAGAPTRTTEFSYAFNVSQTSVGVRCPEGTEAPSLATCQD